MSYSITVRAKTKDDACRQIAEKMQQVLAEQPVHKADAGAATGAAQCYVGALHEEEGKDIVVEMNGSVSWKWGEENGEDRITNANVSIRAYTIAAVAEA